MACGPKGHAISIHALLAESDLWDLMGGLSYDNFYPRSPCGERLQRGPRPHERRHFYPRSPCGERPVGVLSCYLDNIISIHALLAESDISALWMVVNLPLFLSTLSLRRATVTVLGIQHRTGISIHALLAESDRFPPQKGFSCLPIISIHALLAESDLKTPCVKLSTEVFLSTLSLRRATSGHPDTHRFDAISIHALLAESDTPARISSRLEEISIHALLAESDLSALAPEENPTQFLSTLSLRRATRPW